MTAPDTTQFRTGVLLVIGATLAWSLGGTIDRFITADDPWTIVFWRSVFAGLFILGFMLVRDGVAGTRALITAARWPTIIVGVCYAISTVCFVLALSLTSVAKILLIQSAVPILAAAFSWVLLRERVPWYTLLAILAVVAGITTIVSGSLGDGGSLAGDLLSLAIAMSFSLSVVVTRKYPGIRMTPAVLLGVTIAAVIAAILSSGLSVTRADMGWLVAFGMVNLGLGLALFVTGARLIPSVLSALLSVIEPILGPIWVWLVHGETPGGMVLVGGAVVIAALVFNISMDARRAAQPMTASPAKSPRA
ncbi:MAG: DMT family transporter [Rhizobiaceae bacterium]|nr:DMT family transporter [Rhizobiaceae bacterium]